MRENEVLAGIEELSDDDVLAYTQRARRALVENLIEGGMPDDPKERTALLRALADMDQTAIDKKRLGAQQKTADADRTAALLIARMKQTLGDSNPFMASSEREIEVSFDETRIPDVEPVKGETDIGISSESYTEFMDKYED